MKRLGAASKSRVRRWLFSTEPLPCSVFALRAGSIILYLVKHDNRHDEQATTHTCCPAAQKVIRRTCDIGTASASARQHAMLVCLYLPASALLYAGSNHHACFVSEACMLSLAGVHVKPATLPADLSWELAAKRIVPVTGSRPLPRPECDAAAFCLPCFASALQGCQSLCAAVLPPSRLLRPPCLPPSCRPPSVSISAARSRSRTLKKCGCMHIRWLFLSVSEGSLFAPA